jgi:hypothetical protein
VSVQLNNPADIAPEPYSSFTEYEKELLSRPCKCGTSTGIDDTLTRGTGRLDFNGFWEFPCEHNAQGE